jgi:hypothetical protein
MYTYCTIRDVRAALTPEASPADKETASGFADWQIEDGIEEAEGIVNAHVLARYNIPTGEVEVVNPEDPMETWVWIVAPSPVRGWTRDIAAWLVTLTHRKSKDISEDDPVRLRYQMVLEMLVAIRDYKGSLPGSVFPPTDEDSQNSVHVENMYEGKLFSPEDFGLGYGAPYQGPQVYWPVR